LQTLCQFIQVSIPVRKEATRVVGLYKNDTWITEKHNIKKDLITKDQSIVPYERGKDAFYHGIDYNETSDEEYREMIKVFYDNVFRLNEMNKVASYIGWLFATPLKPILTELADGFPLLFNHGSQGSGKTSLAQLFMRLVGYSNSEPKSCTMRSFPMLKMLSSTNAIPQWYDEFIGNFVNYRDSSFNFDNHGKDTSFNDGYAKWAPVGSFPNGASWCGALEMVGNVHEWVGDWWSKDYYAISPENNPQGPDTGTYKIGKGGSWYDQSWQVRSSYRKALSPSSARMHWIGFRCIIPIR